MRIISIYIYIYTYIYIDQKSVKWLQYISTQWNVDTEDSSLIESIRFVVNDWFDKHLIFHCRFGNLNRVLFRLKDQSPELIIAVIAWTFDIKTYTFDVTSVK